MNFILAPWRMAYIMSDKKMGCVFCENSLRDGRLVLHEGKTSFITMNLYPYISGHLLIVPYRHVANLEDLNDDERREMFDLASVSVKILKEAMGPEGFNVGINIGRAGGAGVDDHIHLHVVPRWTGDTNFMTALGETRVIPEDVTQTRECLLPYFEKYQREV